MLNFWKLSANTVSPTANLLLNGTPNLFIQQIRNTAILKRMNPLRLYKKGGRPHKFKKRDFYYELEENTNLRKPKPLDIILTQYVENFGEKGQKIILSPNKAYNEFLLPGLAVYASPENIEKYLIVKQDKKKVHSSLYAPSTIKYLSRCCLIVHMSVSNPWVLEKWHIRTNFRSIGIIVTEESITMPEKLIAGPNLDNEGKEFYVKLTINKTEEATVRCRLHHDTFDPAKQLECPPDFWSIPGKALFPEDQEVLDALPRPKFEDYLEKDDLNV